jgi:hypothetical protein
MGVHFVKLNGIDLGSLQNLNLPDGYVLKGIDELTGLGDLLGIGVLGKVLHEVIDVDGRNFLGKDGDDLLSDGLDLRGLGISGLLGFLGDSLGESNGEHTDDVPISSLNIYKSLDQTLPLSDELA